MAFEDVQKRMAASGPSPMWMVFAIAGVLLIALNFVINQAAWEGAQAPGQYSTTYVPMGIGLVSLIVSPFVKRFPWIAARFGMALIGLALIGLNVALNEWSRSNAESAGWSSYWVSYLPAGLGCMCLIASVTALGSTRRAAN